MKTDTRSFDLTEPHCFASALCSEHIPNNQSFALIDHPDHDTFLSRFEEQVALTPDSVAIVFENHTTNYRQLNAQANQLARYLIQRGFEREDRIGICLDRSTEAIVAMLGILKSGCAFVPLDPEFPAERLAYIVEHANIKLILCDDSYRRLFHDPIDGVIAILSPDASELWNGGTDNLQQLIAPDSLAYVMYTSGSTGKPKGVQIEHRSLLTYCLADIEIYKLTGFDRTLQFSTLNFDVAIEEIYPPLLVGGTVVVRPRQRSAAAIELSELIESNSITALHIATAYWNEWIDLMLAANVRVPRSLRLVIVTGEKISVEHYRRWQSLCDQPLLWCNAYGPTETTVTCTVFIPTDDWDEPQMPIGKPLKGYDAYILTEQLAPVVHGETGHLFIGGPALARGYLGRQDLTDKAFIDVQLPGESSSRRIYRTGDLARWLPSGDIEFSGRVDHQMKIGSYRIEPGEIESIINQHTLVRESLVICDEVEGQKYLVAYIVSMNQRPTAVAIADFCRGRLPAYMVPTRYLFLESMPKTINGKIDRAALPAASGAEVAHVGDVQEASTELERELTTIFKKVLNISQVGINDDFFLLGGSSLLVTRVIAQIAHKLSFAMPVRDFFANPTIATIARHIERHNERALGIANADADMESHCAQLRRELPKIYPWAVQSNNCRLHAIHYQPGEAMMNGTPTQRKQHALILVPSLGHEYARAHRNLQQLAVHVSKHGFDAIRFDFAATGNSTGEACQLNVSQFQSDIRSMVKAAREQLGFNTISVLGVRLGATLAIDAQLTDINTLIAWDPVVDGRKYYEKLQEFHRSELTNLTKYLTVRNAAPTELLGYAWPRQLSEDVVRLNLAGVIGDRQSTVVQIGAKTNWIVSSKGDLSAALRRRLTNKWRFRDTDDEILWNDFQYINSAFASPDFYRCVVELLTGTVN